MNMTASPFAALEVDGSAAPTLPTLILWAAAALLFANAVLLRGQISSRTLGTLLLAVTLGELHESLHLRIPGPDLSLPGFDDAIGREATAALEHLRQPLQAPFARSVGSFFPPHPELPQR